MEIQQHPSLEALRQTYFLKALECIPKEHRNRSNDEEVVALLETIKEPNLLPQLVQLLTCLSRDCCSILSMKFILQVFKNSCYMQRSHVIRFMSYLPKEQRTLAVVQKMFIFFLQVVDKCRYDIFRALDAIPEQERYEVVEEVALIVYNSTDWFLASKRSADLIEAIYQMDPKKRKEASFFCQQYPLIFLQQDIFSALCFFYPNSI